MVNYLEKANNIVNCATHFRKVETLYMYFYKAGLSKKVKSSVEYYIYFQKNTY